MGLQRNTVLDMTQYSSSSKLSSQRHSQSLDAILTESTWQAIKLFQTKLKNLSLVGNHDVDLFIRVMIAS